MKNLFRLIVAVVMLAGWSLAALALHVVHGPGNRVIVIPKQSLSWRDIYVDTSKWTLNDVAAHPELVNRLIQTGKASALQHVAPDVQGDALPAELQSAIQRGPQAKPVEQAQPVSAPQKSA